MIICEKARVIYDDLIKQTAGTSSVDAPGELLKTIRGRFDNFKKRTDIHTADGHGKLKELCEQQHSAILLKIHREETGAEKESVLPNRCWPLRGWKTRPTEEDGQIGTNHSLPLERGALFNRFFR